MKNLFLTFFCSVIVSVLIVWLCLPSMMQFWEEKNIQTDTVEAIDEFVEEEPFSLAVEQVEAPADGGEEAKEVKNDDVTMTSFTQDYLDHEANLSLLNNTTKTISEISARIIYFDMKGNMLDYRDVRWNVIIEPGMSKMVTTPSYCSQDSYVYYKSEDSYIAKHKFKVEFQLKSYKTR